MTCALRCSVAWSLLLLQKNAVRDAFAAIFGGEVEIKIEGVNVESGVSAQPSSDLETQSGALNRARNAKKKLADENPSRKADFYVGVRQDVFLQ